MNIPERMTRFNVPGVSVTYFTDGKISWNKPFGLLESGASKVVNENSIFHACSISKMITALCVLKLVQDGSLDLYKDINEYLISWKISDNKFTSDKKITLANLLAHQAGFRDSEGSFSPYKQGDIIPKTIDILKGTSRYHCEAVEAKYVPETDCEYSDAGYCMVSLILEDVIGETIGQIAKRIVFEPLGLSRTFFWEIGKDLYDGISMSDCVVGHDNKGKIVDDMRASYPNIEGASLWTTPNELAYIVIDIINAYHGISGTILTQEMAKLMLSPYGCTDDVGLGVFLGIDENGKPYFISQGWGVGMQCKLRAYYENQSGVVVMTNSEPGIEQDKALVGEIINDVCNYECP